MTWVKIADDAAHLPHVLASHSLNAEALRRAGCSDRDVVDVNQVASYFNYVNRVVDGLGVELEADWPESARAPRRYGIADRTS